MKKLIALFLFLASINTPATADIMVDKLLEQANKACTKISTLDSSDLTEVYDLVARINRIDRHVLKYMSPDGIKKVNDRVGVTTDVSVLFQMSDGKEKPNKRLRMKIRYYDGKNYNLSCEHGRVLSDSAFWN